MPEFESAAPLGCCGDPDPQGILHAALAGLRNEEEVEIRWLFAPASPHARHQFNSAIGRLQSGLAPGRHGPIAKSVRSVAGAVKFLFGLLSRQPERPAPRHKSELTKIVAKRALEPLLVGAVLARVRASTVRRDAIAAALAQSLNQYGSSWNRLKVERLPDASRAEAWFNGWRLPNPGRWLLTARDAAALCELPTARARDPNLARAPAAQVPPAAMVPVGEGLFLGWPEPGPADPGRQLGLRIEDALRHVLAVGPTGTGKSTFLYWYALSALRSGLGLLLLDPKGDLAEAVLDAVPEHQAKDVAFLDFADTARPIGLNPLAVTDPAAADQTAAAVSTMMRELVTGEGMAWGTTMSQAFAYGFRTLAANPQIQPTMLDLERLFFDREWRADLLRNVKDPFVAAYWANQVDRMGVRQFELNFGSALRRMALLVNDPRVRNILAQARPAVRWDRALKRSAIVLVNLDQADNALGIAGSRLLGSIIVTQFWQAVLRRPRGDRPPFIFLIDEFQEFLDTGRNMGAFFERARSYRVGMCIATQSLAQPRLKAVRRTVMINARTHVVFGGLRDEARAFALSTEPHFSARDLDRREAFQMTVSALVDNRPAPPFSAHVAALPEPRPDRLALRRRRASQLFGADLGLLEESIRRRYGPRLN
ncbi:MAG: type IV secretion system DNA-binding domain-containing protein [Chloroflexota bacterium]|nr:type IV secretion system DNA-binding domain-containing protein [Chloroflexota bacterium]